MFDEDKMEWIPKMMEIKVEDLKKDPKEIEKQGQKGVRKGQVGSKQEKQKQVKQDVQKEGKEKNDQKVAERIKATQGKSASARGKPQRST